MRFEFDLQKYSFYFCLQLLVFKKVFYQSCLPVSVYRCVCFRIVTADVRLDENTAKSSSKISCLSLPKWNFKFERTRRLPFNLTRN